MIERLDGDVLLKPDDISPSHEDFEVVGVFNPGAIRFGNEVVLLVRVAERPRESRPGFLPLPRWQSGEGTVIDWVPSGDWDFLDARVVRSQADGLVRLTFLSHLRVVRCGEGRSVVSQSETCLQPESPLEEFGVEDPRITQIGDRFWITYVTVSRHGASTALMSTVDFRSFQRHSIGFCVENKDVVLFPEPINGEYVALHRPYGNTPFCRPEIWLARSPDLIHWGHHEPMVLSTLSWGTGRIGMGPPPIRTDRGWLAIYHGNTRPSRPGEVGTYSAGALLLDLDDPRRVIGRTAQPFFTPTLDFERIGFVPNVVFPTGIVARGDSVLLYYGAADAATAFVEYSMAELLEAIEP